MSIQFGKCNFDGRGVDPHELEEVRSLVAPYGPDGEGFICNDNVGILHRAFLVTKESYREKQPRALQSGSVLSWDGRLDNRKFLIEQLATGLSHDCSDIEIVAAALERWGTRSLQELIGDWALSVWDPRENSVILAKDFLGTRHLYYRVEGDQLVWCTILEPLILLAKDKLRLEEEYIAGWLSRFPAADITPYAGIHSVPPSSFVRITRQTIKTVKYWTFDPAKQFSYRTDEEYEEHFRSLFCQSVRRRLRSAAPVLAELSGGVDSSSIVCVGDAIIASGSIGTRLDTVSYYDDSEPTWNERPYFVRIEEKRGRPGHHINVGNQATACLNSVTDGLPPTPTSMRIRTEATRQFGSCLTSHGYRLLLSGIGGDEFTGGIPSPTPELADLFVGARFSLFAKRLRAWALATRRPLLHLFADVVVAFIPSAVGGSTTHPRPPKWLESDFVRRNHYAVEGYPARLRLFGALPSFQENLATLELLRRQLACSSLTSDLLYETAYPYLDRDLLVFLFAIPREQLIRPGQRRSLTRRALAGIVPSEILNRRRKGFVSRPPVDLHLTYASMRKNSEQVYGVTLGIVCQNAFLQALEHAINGQESTTAELLRALQLEKWLRQLAKHEILWTPAVCTTRDLAPAACHQRGFED